MHSPMVAQNCNKHFPFLLISRSPCCSTTFFQVALSMPACALKLPKRTRDSDEVAFYNAILTSFRKASYCDFMLGAYTCKIHRDRSCSLSFRRQTFPSSGTQSTTHSAMLGLTSKPNTSLSRHCCINTGVENFPPTVQLNSSRTPELCRRNSYNIKAILLGFANKLLLFSCQ